eukprot:483059-Amphidinium_carterae.1
METPNDLRARLSLPFTFRKLRTSLRVVDTELVPSLSAVNCADLQGCMATTTNHLALHEHYTVEQHHVNHPKHHMI